MPATRTSKTAAAIRVLINADGGTVKAVGVDKQRALIVASFKRHGIAAKVEAVEGSEIPKAVKRGTGPVVVGGGDGSIAAAAGVLAGTDRVLGVLPLGTLNHFAKDLGITDLDAAVDAIAVVSVVSVDVGEVCGRVFINNSSIGFYPQMVAERTREQRASGLPKWPAMALAALRTLKRFPRHRLSIRVEGRERPTVTPCVFIGNNDYELAGLSVGKRRTLDGGGLFLLVVNGRSLWSLAGLTIRAAVGRVEQAKDIDVITGVPHLTIESHASHLDVSLDGEVTRMATPLDYAIRPKALRVFAPVKRPT